MLGLWVRFMRGIEVGDCEDEDEDETETKNKER